jgi:hypothetical protein
MRPAHGAFTLLSRMKDLDARNKSIWEYAKRVLDTLL